MKSKNTLIGVALTIALLLSTAAPALAVGAGTADDGLSVAVDQGEQVVVTVERQAVVDNNTTTVAAENATVTVEALNDSTYAANESFTTDANGTALLPEPQENVSVVVTATWNNSTARTEASLVVANASEGDEAEREFANFGQRISAFVHRMLNAGDADGPLGQYVSEFARENNPGADHRNEQADKKAKKGQEKKGERDDRAKKADERGNQGGKEKAKSNSGQEKKHEGKEKAKKGGKEKGEKRNGHAKKGGNEQDEETDETTAAAE